MSTAKPAPCTGDNSLGLIKNNFIQYQKYFLFNMACKLFKLAPCPKRFSQLMSIELPMNTEWNMRGGGKTLKIWEGHGPLAPLVPPPMPQTVLSFAQTFPPNLSHRPCVQWGVAVSHVTLRTQKSSHNSHPEPSPEQPLSSCLLSWSWSWEQWGLAGADLPKTVLYVAAIEMYHSPVS